MASRGAVPCDCSHTCQKDGKKFQYISRRTRTRHQEIAAQLLKESEGQTHIVPSSTSVNKQVTKSQLPSPIEITSLLLNYNTHLLSQMSLHNKAQDSQTQHPDLMNLKKALMVCTALLHSTSVSRMKINHIINFLNNIMEFITVDLVGIRENHDMKFTLPIDIRSITNQLGIEPVLFQSICCPECYSQYSITNPIRICTQQETQRARKCGADLRGAKDKPIQMYSTQSLISWISKLLQHPEIEEALELCVSHVSPQGYQYIPASKKVAGLGSHAANFPCSYCYIPKRQLHDTEIAKYERRSKEKHLCDSLEWKQAKTKTLRNQLFSKNSVRWAGLNELEYWDPTKMIILDLMHNLAGMLEYHARDLMELEEPLLTKKIQKARKEYNEDKIGLQTKIKDKKTQRHEQNLKEELDGLVKESEDFDIILEIEGIEMEGENVEDLDMMELEKENNLFCTLANQKFNIPDPTMDDGTSSDWSFHPEEDIDTASCDSYGSDLEVSDDESALETSKVLEDAKNALKQLKNLQSEMTRVIIPAWIARPPSNFGNPSHGKLKFDTWFKIFQIFLPLVAADIWSPGTFPAVFDNMQDLIAITRLLTSKKQSSKHSDALRHYIPKYVKDIQEIYNHCEVKPNHHYSLHYPDIIDFSGPSASLSAWAGERINHQLAQVCTNKQMATMSTTMIKHVVRHSNLCLLLKTSSHMPPGILKDTFEALLPFASITESSSSNVKTTSRPSKKLNRDFYLKFHDMCCRLDNYPWQDAGRFPLDLSQPVLSPQAVPHISLPLKGNHITTCKHHEGNSLVQVYSPLYKKRFFGSIFLIFTHTRSENQNSQTESYIAINTFPELSVADSSCSPYLSHQFAHSNIHLRYAIDCSDTVICRLSDVISHIAIHRKPPGTYGISEGTVAIIVLEDVTVL
ncbi:hypothetical protein DFH28DRAFT_899305 [Melampsora americana]|nr:hypothetical protein DFH28DRAFT_899305 [Melampsora americana]